MSNKPYTIAPPSVNLLGDHDRNFKQESRRNKKLRFRKTDKRRRAEKWTSPCSGGALVDAQGNVVGIVMASPTIIC